MNAQMYRQTRIIMERHGFPYNVGHTAQRQWVKENSHKFTAELLGIRGFGKAALADFARFYGLKVVYALVEA